MISKPIIGVLPLFDSEKDSFWMLPGYMEGIEGAGGVPVMLPLTASEEELNTLLSVCGGFLFTGGQDVNPALYGAQKSPHCGEICTARDEMETALLKKALAADKPILGICRGIQIINAALGGTLYQDLETEHPSKIEHHMSPPYDRGVHSVTILKDSPLGDILKTDTLRVNSYHHQAVSTPAPALTEAARSEDGLIEAVYMKDKRFVLAVQWHPEFSFQTDDNSKKIFSAFVAACQNAVTE